MLERSARCTFTTCFKTPLSPLSAGALARVCTQTKSPFLKTIRVENENFHMQFLRFIFNSRLLKSKRPCTFSQDKFLSNDTSSHLISTIVWYKCALRSRPVTTQLNDSASMWKILGQILASYDQKFCVLFVLMPFLRVNSLTGKTF